MSLVMFTCFIAIFAFSYGMQVIPERAYITYANERYLSDCRVNVRRYSRRSNYYINTQITTLRTWGNNITIHLVLYEYLHNEYKRSFVEFHFKLCDMVERDPYVGKAFKTLFSKLGITCPAPAGKYDFMNITIPTENFPNVWPFERSKVDVVLQQTPTNDIIAKSEVFVTFKQPFGKSLPKKKT